MLKDKYESSKELIDAINTELSGYEGYVQFSHRPIDKARDIFTENSPHVQEEAGFIYEAHFCNGSQSILIRQINDIWLVGKTDISEAEEEDMQTYISDIEAWNYRIKMAQIWEQQQDELCEDMEVKKLKKVVFSGFEKGETS